MGEILSLPFLLNEGEYEYRQEYIPPLVSPIASRPRESGNISVAAFRSPAEHPALSVQAGRGPHDIRTVTGDRQDYASETPLFREALAWVRASARSAGTGMDAWVRNGGTFQRSDGAPFRCFGSSEIQRHFMLASGPQKITGPNLSAINSSTKRGRL